MKVAIDVAQTCVKRAGMGWHADAFAHAIVEQTSPQNVMLYHHFGEWLNQNTHLGTFIDEVDAPFWGMPRLEAANLWKEIQTGNRALPLNPDIVHSTSFMAPRIPDAKLVYTIHDLCFWTHPEFTPESNRVLCQRQLLASLQHADAFHFISQSSRDDFEAILPGFLERKNKLNLVAPSGSRLALHALPKPSPNASDSQAPWLFVGTIEPRKNVDALLDAYSIYAQMTSCPRALVLAGGQGWKSADTHERIAQLQQELPISYLGYIDESKLVELYKSAFAFLYPSHYEGFGLPVIEAMSFGLPCIANPAPSIVEFAEGSSTLIDFVDSRAVAQAMIELEANPKHYGELSTAGTKKAEEFTWKKTATSLVEFYQQILGA